MARKSLDNILGEETDVHAEIRATIPDAEPETGVEPEAPEAQPRDESGKFAPKQAEEPKAEPPSAALPKDVYEPLRAVRDENKALKDQLEALRREITQQQQPKEPPAPPPSVWEDENAWGGALVGQAVQQATLNARLDMSEMMVRQANPDFEEYKAAFLEMAQANPALVQQALADPHPWQKAYNIAKNARQMQELGATSIDELKAQLRAQIEAEMAASKPAVPNIPPSLSTQRSVSGRTGPAWSGPKPLNELL